MVQRISELVERVSPNRGGIVLDPVNPGTVTDEPAAYVPEAPVGRPVPFSLEPDPAYVKGTVTEPVPLLDEALRELPPPADPAVYGASVESPEASAASTVPALGFWPRFWRFAFPRKNP